MRLHLQADRDVTLIGNDFIDRYMPQASGEFVKVYLYLLRCASSDRQISVSSIADVFSHTEKDVHRALNYWEKHGLLRCVRDGSGVLTDVLLTEGTAQKAQTPAVPSASLEGRKEGPDAGALPEGASLPHLPEQNLPPKDVLPQEAVPEKTSLNTARRKALEAQNDFRQLIFIGEAYMGRPMKPAELNNLMYFYDTLHFSPDLIEYLLEYCAGKGNPGPKYMEKVAQEWYRAKITTPAQAKEDSRLFAQDYYTIFRAFGISGRKPAAKEMEYMDRWINDYAFDTDIIVEACSRTILKTHQPDFRYADGILKSWHESGVRSYADIRALDEGHSTMKKAASDKRGGRSVSNNRFNNFEQREHNWDELTRQLIRAGEGD